MKLYLLRHGQAYDAQVQADRPLTPLGLDEVRRIAGALAKNKIEIDEIYQSGVLRAKQTAEIIAQSIHFQSKLRTMPQLNNADQIDLIIDQISGFTENILLVGHIPVLPRLASELLIKNQNREIIFFTPASLVCLEKISYDWTMDWMLTPAIC